MSQDISTSINIEDSIVDTEASYQNIRDQEINKLIHEYDTINCLYPDNPESQNSALRDLLRKLKNYENNDVIKDLINEIETKIRISQVYIDQEAQMKKEIIGEQNKKDCEQKLEQNENKKEDISSKLAIYNKYTDKIDDDGDFPKMSIKFFNKLLSENAKLYYRTYELNDILYLHFKGFRKLENLHFFKNIKVLYLEGNCIKKIEGLDTLTQITSLYLHENLIEKIEGLENLKNLYNLNLSDNCITKIEGLSKLPNLCNVILSRNKIGMNGIDDLKGLLEMEPSVMVVNLENNRITEENVLEEIFVKIPQIRVIYLQGNECLRKISSYRKNFIAKLKELRYLDDRPVFEDERRFAEAFSRGGLEEERRERALYKKEKEEKDIQRIRDFQEMVEGWKGNNEEREKKREEERKKLLEKCKNKLKSKEIKKENEIFTQDDIDASNQTPSREYNISSSEKNDRIDDLPDLETAKNLKEMNYIEYMLDQSQNNYQVPETRNEYNSAKRIIIEEEKEKVEAETKLVEEIIDTNKEKNSKENNLEFEELD